MEGGGTWVIMPTKGNASLPQALSSKQVLGLVTTIIYDHLLKYYARSEGLECKCMNRGRWLFRWNGQKYLVFHYSSGHCGIIDAVYIVGRFIELFVEIDALMLAAVYPYFIFMTSTSQEIEGGFHHHMHTHRLHAIGQ